MATHETLAAALAAFQAELPSIKKGNLADVEAKSGAKFSYRYADLADVSEIALPLLGKHGLAWSAQPTLMDTMFVLHYSLMHEGSGEAIEGIYPLPDATTPPQQLGSAITYARRYALTAITGVAPGGDDDDAQSAPAAPQRPSRPRQSKPAAAAAPAPIPPATVDWAAQIIDCNTEEDLRGVYNLVENLGEMGRPFDPQYAEHLQRVVEVFALEQPPADVKVGAMIGAVKAAIVRSKAIPDPEPEPDDAPMALGDPVTEWETAKPGSGVRFEETPEP